MTCYQPNIPSAISLSIPDDNAHLHNEITRLAGHINAANYRFLKLLAALIERNAWAGTGIKTPVHWLNVYCGIATGAAREKVRVSLALKILPLIDAAFAKGEISYSKVRAMTRMATADNQDYLLMIAQHGTASHVEKLVQQYQYAQRLSSNEHGKAQQEARCFSYYYDDDGMLCFRGKLAPEDGAIFIKAMEAVSETINKETFAQEREVDALNVSAGALLQNNKPSSEQKRADALVRLSEQALHANAAASGGDKYQVVIHLNANVANATNSSPAHNDSDDSNNSNPTSVPQNNILAHAYIENGPVIPPQTFRKLASDACVLTVLEDDNGKVLNVGRKTRTIPPSIRRALSIRDQGCRFPGCCASRFVDAHHIKHWCDGGETSLNNLVLLCRHHHRCLHEDKYSISIDDNGNPVFFDPEARKIVQVVYPQFEPVAIDQNVPAGTFLSIELQHAELGLDIDHETAVTAWLGETMDYGMAVEALLGRQ